MGFFEKIKQGLSKTASSISSVFTASELDDDFYDDLEERLILADLGMDTTVKRWSGCASWCATGGSRAWRRRASAARGAVRHAGRGRQRR